MMGGTPKRRFASLAAALALVGGAALAGDAVRVPHGAFEDYAWTRLPQFGGSEAIIYRSPDGRRVAAAFKESGRFTFTYPFDEFLVVNSGRGEFSVEGGPAFVLTKGQTAYFREGMVVHMHLSRDFSDLTMLTADHPVRWR